MLHKILPIILVSAKINLTVGKMISLGTYNPSFVNKNLKTGESLVFLIFSDADVRKSKGASIS